MKKRILIGAGIIAGLALAVWVFPLAGAQPFKEPRFEVGDKAPKLSVAEWVKGEPVDIHEGLGKHVYVVEFWATWCAPCMYTIPHLTQVQKEFKNRGLICVSITREDPAKVKPFVKKMGDKMDYTIGIDKNDETSRAYMEAANQNGIPHAFVINTQGRLIWQGHPMDPEMVKVINRYAPKTPSDDEEKSASSQAESQDKTGAAEQS